MSANNPTPTLVEAYTAPWSPERGFDLELFAYRDTFDLRSGPSTPPYSMRVEDLVHPAATGINDTLLAQVPEGSAAVVYWDSAGETDIYHRRRSALEHKSWLVRGWPLGRGHGTDRRWLAGVVGRTHRSPADRVP